MAEYREIARKMFIQMVKRACQRATGSSGTTTRSGVVAELEALTEAEFAKESFYGAQLSAEELDYILKHLLKTNFLKKTGRVWMIEAPDDKVPDDKSSPTIVEMEAAFDDDDDEGNGAADDYGVLPPTYSDDDDFGAPPPKRARLLPDMDDTMNSEEELELVDPSVEVL